MSPAGRRKFESLTARTTSSTDSPLAKSWSRFRLTVICRTLPPSEDAGARVDGPDVDDRQVDVREEIDGESLEGDEAEDGHGQRGHQDGDRVAQGEQRHPHATSSPPRELAGRRGPAPFPRR